MKSKSAKGKPAMELVEETTHLVRHAPPGAHVCYYVGSVPFVLALLHFWSDMSHGAFAYDRVAGASLVVALLFVWMKCWHAVSAAKLRAYVAGEEQPRWPASRVARLVIQQAALQPTALIARPVALLIALPYAWVRAFYEYLVILGDGTQEELSVICSDAKKQARLWPMQNHVLLLLLMGFGVVIWVNIVISMVTVSQLIKAFTGIETVFTESIYPMLNTTFLATSIACTYLCVNPFTKAAYVLRCFYGEAVQSGNDLRLEMRRAVRVALAAAAVLLFCAPMASGETAAPEQKQVAPAELNASISRVLKRDEFAWRMPRQKPPQQTGESFLSRFLSDAVDAIKTWVKPIGKSLGKLLEKLFNWKTKNRPHDDDSAPPSFEGLKGMLNAVLWGLCVVIVCMICWLFFKNKYRIRRAVAAVAEEITARPDLTSEDLVATQLPEDEWLKLAREMMEKGEFRLAVRALYLAALAHLSLKEFITIARHKSNRDYQRELRRRSRGDAGLQEVFGESVSLFEGAWYGAHEVSAGTVQLFSTQVERIRAT